MGIDGLLNLLKPVTQKQHISSFKDKTVAVDAMPWIYKGCYSCAMELNQNIESIDFLYYILEMLDMLSYYNIKPIFVFDGRSVHAKSDTLQKRKKTKEQNKQKGLQFLKNNQMEQARKYLSRCIIIDQRIISMTINALVTKNIQFIVAPYEADCQIAKLKRLGIIDGVISQDSDLITFGVNVILKLNQNGQCDYIDLNKWRPKDVTDVFLKYFLAFDQLTRIDAAILAGSDYNKSVKGIGIKRAVKLLTTQVTMNNVINKLKYKKAYMSKVPQEYEKTVQKSKLIFNLSTVYNPITKQLEYLRPQLLDQLKPEEMSQQQLIKIVGVHYGYNEQVASGRITSKTLQRRQIKTLNFPQMFRVNKQNMNAHEVVNKRRKLQQKQLRQIKEQQNRMNQNGDMNGDQYIFNQLNEFKKRAVTQLTQQEIQKRKQQRKNRISKLQQLMNTLVDVFQDSDDQVFGDNNSEDQDELKKTSDKIELDKPDNYTDNGNHIDNNQSSNSKNTNFPKNGPSLNLVNQNSNLKNGNINIKNTNTKAKNESECKTAIKKGINSAEKLQKDYISQQQSLEEDLGFLNPFLKKEPSPLVKTPNIFGQKKK